MTDLPVPAGAPRVRLAAAGEAAIVKAIVTESFLDLYRNHDHPTPRPTTVDFAPLIEAGQVWLVEAPAGNDAVPVGVLVLEQHPHYLRIDIVAILPAHQHRGYGRAAIGFAEAQAAARGLGEVRFYTNSTIARNVAFYSALGYVETGRWRPSKRPNEVYVDFAKTIAPTVAGPGGGPERRSIDGGQAETALDRPPPRAT
jgi:ribosomal protein S18 acetylase RimI-like enzyme